MARETFGNIDKLPSGRFRARYVGGDGARHKAPQTFARKTDARIWLAEQQTAIASGRWQPSSALAAAQQQAQQSAQRRNVTLARYAETWVAERTNARGEPLRARTRHEYERMLRAAGSKGPKDVGGPLAPLLDSIVGDITPKQVRRWRTAALATGTSTQTSRAYDLLKSIIKTAIEDGIADSNPCTIRGGSSTTTGKEVRPPTDDELATILEVIEPRYRALVAVAAFGGLRFGEAVALRAKDVEVRRGDDGEVDSVRINVTGGVTATSLGRVAGPTKSAAGVRSVAVYGADALLIAEHARALIGDALLFPAADGAGYLAQSTFHRHWDRARVAADRGDLPFHGLRHYAGTLYAQTGATVKETMARLGHSSQGAAMRYQHSGSRDEELARRMSKARAAATSEPSRVV